MHVKISNKLMASMNYFLSDQLSFYFSIYISGRIIG